MDAEEMGRLILDAERQLYITARTILSNDQDCADAIQETIVKAISKVGSLKNDAYAKTWVIRILLNECYAIKRRCARTIPMESLDEKRDTADSHPEFDELYAAIQMLKEALRLPIVLYYIEGFSVREVAGILKISEGAVQKRLARAREKLRASLEESEAMIGC